MARRRRSYGDLVALPGLGDVTAVLKSSVKGTDVLVGALASLAGIYAVKWVQNRYLVGKLPEVVLRFTPAIAGGLTGVALFMLQKKKNRSRAAGHAIGAVSAGLAINALNELKAKFPQMADIVDLRLSGLIVNDPTALNGLIVNDPTALNGYGDNPDLAGLAALDMGLGDNDEDGLDALVS